MNMNTLKIMILLLFGSGFFSQQAFPQDSVYVLEIEEMIDNGLATYTQRGVEVATKNKAAGLLIHLDTFGGLVDAADKIRKLLLDAPMPVVVFIDKNAASAGALISLAADSIYMAPGSSIGAATVVEGGSGKKASEKMQSYMRGLMRSTAEANGRNPMLAEAMVDESIEIENIISGDKLLTLSDTEAVKYKMANATVSSLDEALERAGWSGFEQVHISQQWEESLLRFLSNPIISSILMLMMMGGLYFELQSPGFGFGGIASAVAALAFFSPLYIMGLAESWEIVLFFIGVVLIVVEIFFIPGFGIPGILGTMLLIFSLGATLIGNIGLDFPSIEAISEAIWTLSITLILGVVMMYSLSKYLPANPYFNRLVLDTSSERDLGYVSATPAHKLVGTTGTAITALRPSGVVKVKGKRLDVVSDGGFIDAGEQVRVESAASNRVVVTKISEED